MATAKTRKELEEHFQSAVQSEDVMGECLQMCTLFDLSPEDLFYKWEAFSYSGSVKDRMISTLTIDGAKELHAYLRQQRAAQAAVSTPVMPRVKTLPKSVLRGFGGTPKMSPSPFRTPQPMQTRIVRVPDTPTIVNHRPKAQYIPPANLTEFKYLYMREKISERSGALDDLIEDFAELVKSRYGVEDLGDPSAVTEAETLVVGRICSDSDEKLNESSILLESSRILGSGKRVPLSFLPSCTFRTDVTGRSTLGLFPGQIVLLKGKNGDRKRYLASEVWSLPRLLAPSREIPPPGVALESDDPTDLIVACGPFSFDRDLEFQPLAKLLQQVEKHRPSVLILLGPFIDAQNELIKTANINLPPAETFQSQISAKLDSLLVAVPGISIFLVPSVRDIVHDHVAVPQSAFDKEQLGLSQHIVALPNPSVFRINGVAIGVSSTDILMHLNSQQINKRLAAAPLPATVTKQPPPVPNQATDAMIHLSRHILEQRSFYPVFPVPQQVSSSVNLDVTHSHLLRLGQGNGERDGVEGSAPDLLILPSRLKHFHRVVDCTIVVNPGFATRGQDFQTYAKISLPSVSSLRSLENANLASMATVEIVKMDD